MSSRIMPLPRAPRREDDNEPSSASPPRVDRRRRTRDAVREIGRAPATTSAAPRSGTRCRAPARLAAEHGAQRAAASSTDVTRSDAIDAGGRSASAARTSRTSMPSAGRPPRATAVERELVEPAAPCTTHARSAPRRCRTCAIGSTQRAPPPDTCRRTPAGIGERPEQVEERPDAELAPRRGRVRSAGWNAGANRNAKPVSRRQADAAPVEREPHAERLQHVGAADRAGRRAVPVLRDGHAGRGHDERRRGRDVERPAPSPPVPHVSIAPAGRPARASCARAARAPRRQLVDGLALHAERDSRARRSAPASSRPGEPSHDGRHLVLGERPPPTTARDRGLGRHRARRNAREEVREQPLALEREDRLGMELHALDEVLAMAARP
jgi:hypothetical protein